MKFKKFSKALTIVLEEEIYHQIKSISDQQRLAMAEWVRDVLTKALDDGGARTHVINLNQNT